MSPSELTELARSLEQLTGPERTSRFKMLAGRTSALPDQIRVYRSLAAIQRKLGLEFLCQLPVPIAPPLVLLGAQALQVRKLSRTLRFTVAVRLLESVPDRPQTVGPIVRSLISNLSGQRALERLIRLQSRVEVCTTLDEMVMSLLARVKYSCRACQISLSRDQYLVHLWQKHRQVLIHGKVVEPAAQVEQQLALARAHPTSANLSAAFELIPRVFPGTTELHVLQAFLAREKTPDTPALRNAALEARSTICPTCCVLIPYPLKRLAPAAVLTDGRFSTPHDRVIVEDRPMTRRVEITSPLLPTVRFQQTSPRGLAVMGAVVLAILLMPVVLAMNSPRLSPLLLAVLAGVVVTLGYFVVRWMRKPLPSADEIALEQAWVELAPLRVKDRSAPEFFVALCRASLGRPGRESRVSLLKKIDQRLADIAQPSGQDRQMHAAVALNRVWDREEKSGPRDRMVAVAELCEVFFSGQSSPSFLEAVAEIILTDAEVSPTDRLRLRLLILESAFQQQLGPKDLAFLLRFLPNFRTLLQDPTAAWLRLVYAVWRGRNTEPWQAVGKARTLFELARNHPSTARKVLAHTPTALLKLELPDSVDRQLGDVCLSLEGLTLAGVSLSDTSLTLDLIRSPRGAGYVLVLGPHRVQIDRKIPPETLNLLWNWVQFYQTKLLGLPTPGMRTSTVRKLLSEIICECGNCGTVSLGTIGQVGEIWT